MPYNLTLINSSGILSLTQTVNTELMFGYFGVMTLLSIFVIAFLSMNQYSNETTRSLSIAMFITALLSLPLRILSLVSDEAVFICLVLAAAFMLLLYVRE